MGMFANMKTDDLEKSEDRVGGGAQAVATDVYDAKINMLFITESKGGAKAANLIATINGAEYKETFYFTTKNGSISYADKQDAKKQHPLPGFSLLNDICLLVTGEGLNEQDPHVEEKIVKIYVHAESKDVPTAVPVITSLTGGDIKLAISRIKEFKQAQNAAGSYEDTTDIRVINEINKVMHSETGRTVNEYLHEVEPAEFMPAWLKQRDGKDIDKTTGKAGAGSTGSGRPAAAAAGGTVKKGLFDKK
jgi:hypothetical protein